MDVHKLDEMKNGWFIGDFEPSVFRTREFEVGLHKHQTGDPYEPHFHVLAAEVNVLVRGRMIVNGQTFSVGDIFVVRRKEVCEVEFLEDCEVLVVKSPSVPGDKYAAELLASSTPPKS